VQDISIVDRQASDFYGAIATGRENVTAEWTVDPNPAALDSDITLTLSIRAAANPQELTRPDLKVRADFSKHFQIDDLPTVSTVPPEAGVARFRYRLRPREAGSFALPALVYRFYRPRFPEGRRFQTTYARLKEPIHVTPSAEKPKTPVVPIAAPEAFFTRVPEDSTRAVPVWAWVIPVLLVPVVVTMGTQFLRWCFPDATRLARVRRNQAARVALRQLARTRNVPTETVSAILRTYLVARFGLPIHAVTPAEIATDLQERGWPPEAVDPITQFFNYCDALRFSPHGDTGLSLRDMAVSLIVTEEGRNR
jgi:hypothetical protein